MNIRRIRFRAAPFVVLLLALGAPPAAAPSAATGAAHAELLFQQGRHRDALDAFDATLAALDAGAPAAPRARLLMRRGETLLALGRTADAVQTLGDAAKLAGASGEQDLIAAGDAALGNALALAGDADAARPLLESARSRAGAIGRDDVAAAAGNDLANLLAARGDAAAAVAVFERAAGDALAAGDTRLQALATVNLARALHDAGRRAEVPDALRRALELLHAAPASHDIARGLVAAARLQAGLDVLDGDDPRLEAAAALREAGSMAAAAGDLRTASWANGYLGELYREAGRPADALELTRRAAEAARRADAPEALYRWEWQIGRLLHAGGDETAALAAYERAVDTLQAVRPDLAGGYAGPRVSFREQVGPVYLELADLRLRRAARLADRAALEEELRRVRATLEQLKGAELADYFQDDCVAALKSRTAGIDSLAARTAALYPVLLPDRVELLVSLPDGMQRVTVPVTGEALTAEVLALRRLLEKRITNEYLPHARRLYDWLLRPLEPQLREQAVSTLVMVPDGALRTVPLAALHDGERFVIERFAVATTPGLTLTDPRPLEEARLDVLLTGLTEGVQGFPPLPHVASEIARIQAEVGGTVLENQQFSASAVRDALAATPFSVVHIASHGQFSADPAETFLLTWDGRLDMDALQRSMAITNLRTQPVELLTLSACQTAAGDDRAALGLAGVAVKAGARSALATLWFINDEASAKLVSAVYEQLAGGTVSKAEALRRAQLSLLAERGFSHPAYWSPFLLIGNWL